jgi:hypothetical protein
MSTSIACPFCGTRLSLPEGLVGQAVRCPACDKTFDAAQPVPKPEPLLRLELDDPAPPVRAASSGLVGAVEIPSPGSGRSASPPRSESDHLHPCPACGQLIHRDSTSCYRCGASIRGGDDVPRRRARVLREVAPHRGLQVFWVGVCGLVLIVLGPIGFALGLIAWLRGAGDLRQMTAKRMDPAGIGLTRAGWLCGVLATILSSLWMVGCFFLFVFAIAHDNGPDAFQRMPATKKATPFRVK